MPRKLRCSLTILAAIALVAAFASSAAQAQFKNATGPTKGTALDHDPRLKPLCWSQ
ncbi:MAG: hypothetical protein WA763_08630 [Pseudolabrys sp.]